MKLIGLTRGDHAAYVLRFDTGRVVELPPRAFADLFPKGAVVDWGDLDVVRRRALQIGEHPAQFGARITSCAELLDPDRRLPFDPPRPWCQADGDDDSAPA